MLRMSPEEFISEWLHTYCRHNGEVVLAAPIFEVSPAALERRLFRLKSKGHDLKFLSAFNNRRTQ